MKQIKTKLYRPTDKEGAAKYDAVAIPARAEYDAALAEADRVCQETKEAAWKKYQAAMDTVRNLKKKG